MKVASEHHQPTDNHKTFIFHGEGHTLGNALRGIIMTYPEVVICGYNVPHPSEKKLNLRIQTNGIRAVVILQRALRDLEKFCDHTLQVFDEAMLAYKQNEPEDVKPTI